MTNTTTDTINQFEETRDALFFALGECIAAAPQEAQKDLAAALEEFAALRGAKKYNHILSRSSILQEIFAVIEECTDARLFIGRQA